MIIITMFLGGKSIIQQACHPHHKIVILNALIINNPVE